jgi:hypothetical protein
LTPAAVKVADGDDRKNREDDAEKADDEHDVTGVKQSRLCEIDGLLQARDVVTFRRL